MIARSAAGSIGDTLTVRFNNDSGSNYYRQRIRGTGSTIDTAYLTSSGLDIGLDTVTGSLANSFGVTEFTIYGYASTTWLKALQYNSFALYAASTGNLYVLRGGGQWNSTAAITRIQISDGSLGNFATGSQLRIYGRL